MGATAAEANVDLNPFKCFREWAVQFCEAAKIDLRIQATQKEVTELEDRLASAKMMQQRFFKIEKNSSDLRFESFFDLAANNVQSRKEFMSEIVTTDHGQAEAYQKNLKKFEKEYFEPFMQIYQQKYQ